MFATKKNVISNIGFTFFVVRYLFTIYLLSYLYGICVNRLFICTAENDKLCCLYMIKQHNMIID